MAEKELTAEEVKALQAEKEATVEEVKKLQAENKKLADELVSLNEAVAKKDEFIKGLNEAIAEKDEAAQSNSKRPVIKVGKEQYSLRFPRFFHNFKGVKTEVDKKVLEENPELAKELVEKGSGALVLIKKGGK